MSRAEITAYLAGSDWAATHEDKLRVIQTLEVTDTLIPTPELEAAFIRLGETPFWAWVYDGIIDYAREHGLPVPPGG